MSGVASVLIYFSFRCCNMVKCYNTETLLKLRLVVVSWHLDAGYTGLYGPQLYLNPWLGHDELCCDANEVSPLTSCLLRTWNDNQTGTFSLPPCDIRIYRIYRYIWRYVTLAACANDVLGISWNTTGLIFWPRFERPCLALSCAHCTVSQHFPCCDLPGSFTRLPERGARPPPANDLFSHLPACCPPWLS